MFIRILFLLMTLLILVRSAPSPYFTRSFVQTPSSTYEQYLIVPDKSDAYRVPMSQVHHYSDFQFPKQQVVYYNPSTGTNQHRLQALQKDNPLWQQMLMNLHSKSDENMLMSDDAEISKMSDAAEMSKMGDATEMSKMSEMMEMKDNSDQKVMNEDTMRMILDQESPILDMMEKLKRDDTKMSELIKTLEESTTFAPKILTQPIVVANNEDMIRDEVNAISDETEQINVEKQQSLNDQVDRDTEPNMLELAQNSTDQIMRVSPLIHPEMTRVIVPESDLMETENLIKAAENNDQSTNSEASNEIQTETPILARIAELISNVEPLEISTIMNQLMNQDIQEASTTAQPPLRRSKEMTLEIMRNIKDHPEIMIKIVELAAASIQEMESDLRNESGENDERVNERIVAVTEPSMIQSTDSMPTEADQVNISESTTINSISEFSTESTQSATDVPNSTASSESPTSDNEMLLSTENSMALLETSSQISLESTVPQIDVRFDDSMVSLVENTEPEIDSAKEEIEAPTTTTTQIPMQNILETTESIESFSESEEVRADIPVSTESITESTQSLESLPSSTEPEQIELSTEAEAQEIIQSSTELKSLESSQTTEAIKSINDESTEAINTPITESIILQESSTTESSGMIQEIQIVQITMTSKTDNSDQFNSTMAENIEQSVSRSDIQLNVNDNESNENKIISSDEQTSSDSGERESESQEEQITLQETPQSESGETMREGRVNKAPTMFLHNNRFYVISGVPEFYANFDAYQNPRTPIFSLQELQPIRPMNNVAVQKIEPFRIFVDDNEKQKSSTQDDNEPFKMQNSTTDNPRSDIENIQSINMEQRESEMQREMTVKVKKRVQDRQPASEARQDTDYEEEPSVAQASPEATSIAGRGGVASAGPKGTALSNKSGISVASPRATAIAGKFNLNESDDGIDVDFEDDVKVQNRRRVQVAKRKIIRGRRNWRM